MHEAVGLARADAGGTDDEPAGEQPASPAAIGERTEFIEQTKSTVGSVLSRSSMRLAKGCTAQIRVNSRRAVSRSMSSLLSRRVRSSSAASVVEAPPGHVDGFDLVGRGGLDGVVIGVADAGNNRGSAAGTGSATDNARRSARRCRDCARRRRCNWRRSRRAARGRCGGDAGRVEGVQFDQIVDRDAPFHAPRRGRSR